MVDVDGSTDTWALDEAEDLAEIWALEEAEDLAEAWLFETDALFPTWSLEPVFEGTRRMDITENFEFF